MKREYVTPTEFLLWISNSREQRNKQGNLYYQQQRYIVFYFLLFLFLPGDAMQTSIRILKTSSPRPGDGQRGL